MLPMAARTALWLAFVLTSALLRAQLPPNELLAKALQNPNDQNVMGQVLSAFHSTKDPATLSRLRDLFQVVTEKSSRRLLAVLMFVTLGPKDDLYFDVLAKYAQDSVVSDAPPPFFFDPEGTEIRSNLTLVFTNWCEVHQMKSDVCLATVAEQAVDAYYLGLLKDKRGIPTFRRGLESNNVAIVRASSAGLALLNDIDSISLIVTAARRFPPKLQPLVADMLAQFDDPRAWPPIDEFIKDPKYRQDLDDSIRRRLAQPATQ
jgi:hypothetical protein